MTEGILKSVHERKERVKEKRPNALTRKTLKKSKDGEDVTEYDDVEQMFEEWGI